MTAETKSAVETKQIAPSSSPVGAGKSGSEEIPKVPALIINAEAMRKTVDSISHGSTKTVLQATLVEALRLADNFESNRQDPFLAGEGLAAHQNAAKNLSELEALIIADRAKMKGPDTTSKGRAEAVFKHLEQACSTVRQKLKLQSTETALPPEPQWKMHRLRLEQTLFLESSLNTAFNEALESVAKRARTYSHPKSVFICYAWPNLKDDREAHLNWIQPFLKGLRKHLHDAGLATVKLDIMDGKPGGNIYEYMESARTSDFVLLIGTESLICRHEMGLSAVCTELVHIRRKRRDDKEAGKGERVFPILLSGDYSRAFPPEFDRYSTVDGWNEDHKTYFDHLCGLIPALYSTDKEAFEDIWKGFLEKLSLDQNTLVTKGLKEAAVEDMLSKETVKKKADEEASNRAARSLLGIPHAHTESKNGSAPVSAGAASTAASAAAATTADSEAQKSGGAGFFAGTAGAGAQAPEREQSAASTLSAKGNA